MADKAQRPPAPYVEGEHYAWVEEFQAYVGEDKDGVLIYWDADEDAWVDYPKTGTLEGASPEMARAAEIAKAAGDIPYQPYFWDEARDGKYPADWDERRYGEYPAVVDKEGFIVKADHVKAAAIKAAVDAITSEEQQGRIVEGDGVFAPKGTLWNVSPTGAISEWKPPVTPVPLPEGKARVISEGGYDWAYNPATGDYTDFIGKTPEKVKRSVDQMILDYYEAGDFDSAFKLDTFLDEIERPRGLTPSQAVQEIMNLAVAPDEAREWIDALTDDWNAVRSTEERVESPGKAFFPTAEEKAQQAAQGQGGASLGTGLPAGLGQGAEGLQFPAFLTTAGGQQPAFTTPGYAPGLLPGQTTPTGTLTPEQVAAIKAGTFPQQPLPGEQSPFGLTPEQQASLGQGQMTEAAKMASLGMEEYIRQQVAQQPAFNANGYAPGLLPGQTTPAGTIDPAVVAAIKGGTFNAALVPGAAGVTPEQLAEMPEAANAAEAAKKAAGLPYNVKDRYTGGIGYVFQPTASFKTRAQEFPETTPLPLASIPGATTKPLFEARTAVPSTTTGTMGMGSNPLFRQQQIAAFKRGDIAQFEKGLFGLSKPLSVQDTLQQMLYRKWGQKRQAQFEARPVARTAFK